MSIGDGIYQSVRLFCVTLFLIALLHVALPMSQLWMLYTLRKDAPNPAVSSQRDVPFDAPIETKQKGTEL
jgi:hypothetical protein